MGVPVPIKTVYILNRVPALTWSASYHYNLKPFYHNYWFEFYPQNSKPLTSRQLNSLAPWISDCNVKHLRFRLLLLINVFNFFLAHFPDDLIECGGEPTLVSVMAWWTTLYVALVVTRRWADKSLHLPMQTLSDTHKKTSVESESNYLFENDYCKRQ